MKEETFNRYFEELTLRVPDFDPMDTDTEIIGKCLKQLHILSCRIQELSE